MGSIIIEDKKMGKRALALVLSSLLLTTGTACAGTVDFVVPPCDAEAVVETAASLAGERPIMNPRKVKLRNIRQVTYHPNETRTCVSTVKDSEGRNRDFFYAVVMTHGIKWAVSGVDL